MKTLEISTRELLELRFLTEKRFEVVWSRYCDMVRLREYTDVETLASFRDDVLEVVSLLRKLKKSYLGK